MSSKFSYVYTACTTMCDLSPGILSAKTLDEPLYHSYTHDVYTCTKHPHTLAYSIATAPRMPQWQLEEWLLQLPCQTLMM